MRKTLIAVLGVLALASTASAADSQPRFGTIHGPNRSPASAVQSPDLKVPTSARPAIFVGDLDAGWVRYFPVMNAKRNEILAGRGWYAPSSPKTSLQTSSVYRNESMHWPVEP
ncbi:MAG: hypothetical protein ACXWPM_05245 [Bdellovibrionota bacterium]